VHRIVFHNISRPKAAAKNIATAIRRPLSAAQQAVALCSGYRDWHDLEQSLSNGMPDSSFTNVPPSLEQQALMSCTLASELELTSGDALYALGVSRLIGPSRIEEQLTILTKLFRLREIPAAGRRQRGTVGRLKSPGRNGEIVILKNFDKPTLVVTHQSGNGGVADFEYLTPREPVELFIPMRLYLAYGAWIERDGAKVLFSRDYCPLWRIREGRIPERMYPWERIAFVRQEFFWRDGEHIRWPWHDPKNHQSEIERLHTFGIHLLPKLVDTLPLVVSHDDLDFRAAVSGLPRPHEPPLVA
jgi:hypothetical protein